MNHLKSPASTAKRVIFLLVPSVHLLDLSGPAQSFYEANELGGSYELMFVSNHVKLRSAQGLMLSDLLPLPELHSQDTIIVPGILSDTIDHLSGLPMTWLQQADQLNCRICSICSGSFVLAQSGILNGRKSTTHWKLTTKLQENFPQTQVLENRLFVRDDHIMTSAGESSGIDLSLTLISEDQGALVSGRVAREMVVYMRREGYAKQDSLFVTYRNHIHQGVHKIQDWIANHPQQNPSVESLASVAGMSARNLTRVFRQVTGTTVRSYVNKIKMEIAKSLLDDQNRTIENVAYACGFEHPRQFRRVWKQSFGFTPTEYRRRDGPPIN